MNCRKGFVRSATAGLVLMSMMGAQAAGSLADAKSKIAAGISNPAVMTATVKGLSAADRKTFVAELNKAIGNLAGKPAAKVKTYVEANQAALAGAEKANLPEMVGAVYASAPVEVLPAIAESFAKNLFNRSASNLSDAQYTQLSEKLMTAVNASTAQADNGAVRSTFAIVMLVKGSNGSPSGLGDTLVKTLPSGSREAAAKEWLPSALKGNYDPMLGSADAGAMPKSDLVIRATGPQFLDIMMSDLGGAHIQTAVLNPALNVEPMNGIDNEQPVPMTPVETKEPQGYNDQWL